MNNNTEKSDWAKRDIGALWKRESTSQKYLSGYVKFDELGTQTEVKIIVFSNKNKKDNAKAPDYRIYVSKPAAPQGEQKTSEKPVATSNQKKVVKKQAVVEESADVEDDSIL